MIELETGFYSEDGYHLTWTADGENYQFVITRDGHIISVGSGCGHNNNVKPTEKNKSEALKRFLKNYLRSNR